MTTSSPGADLRPVSSSDRINSIDVVRGIALLGILLMNIVGFGLAFAYSDPTNSGGATGWNLKAWAMNNMLFEGTMRGLFTMLFGAGFILQTSRGEARGGGLEVADVYYRRVLWLLFFGIIHVYLILWYGDILYPYAVFGLMLFPLRNVKPKYLLIAGLVLLAWGSWISVKHYHEDKEKVEKGLLAEKVKEAGDSLSAEQSDALKEWEGFQKQKKTPEQVEEENEKNRAGYGSIVMSRLDRNEFMQSSLLYFFWSWDILPLMLIGMAFFKWKVFQAERSFKFYVTIMLIGYAIGLSVNYYETTLVMNGGFDLLLMSQADMTYQLGRIFTTLGHIGLIMIFVKSGIIGFLQRSLSAVGRMALTNYLMHSVICAVFFMGFGFGMFGRLERFELYYVVFSIWIVQLIYSPIWLRYFHYGPAEWAWRSLTYLKKQPFRIKL